MPVFSQKSLDILSQADPLLQKLFNEVIKTFDCTIVCSYRGKEDQLRAYNGGKSKLNWPESKHNSLPSKAVDVMPYYPGGIRWQDEHGAYFFAGYVKHLAEQLGIKIRWGGDWDGDSDTQDQQFNDLPHFELVD